MKVAHNEHARWRQNSPSTQPCHDVLHNQRTTELGLSRNIVHSFPDHVERTRIYATGHDLLVHCANVQTNVKINHKCPWSAADETAVRNQWLKRIPAGSDWPETPTELSSEVFS